MLLLKYFKDYLYYLIFILVIDEAPPEDESEIEKPSINTTPIKKGRGRPPKVPKNIEPIENEPVTVKEEIVEEAVKPEKVVDVTEAKPLKTPKMRMAPKSKTWFPSREKSKTTSSRKILRSPTSNVSEIKREVKEPDMKVFGLSEEVYIDEDFMSKNLKAKTETKKQTEIVSRLER